MRADRVPVADPAPFFQQQTQLYYAFASEEAGNIRHDLHTLASLSGLAGQAAEVSVRIGVRATAAGSAAAAAAAAARLEELNALETEELLASVLANPEELEWQQALLDNAQHNRDQLKDLQ